MRLAAVNVLKEGCNVLSDHIADTIVDTHIYILDILHHKLKSLEFFVEYSIRRINVEESKKDGEI